VSAVTVSLLLTGFAYAEDAPTVAAQPAPTRIFAGAKIFIESDGEFAMALGASFLEKKVPVTVFRRGRAASGYARRHAHSNSKDRDSGPHDLLHRASGGREVVHDSALRFLPVLNVVLGVFFFVRLPLQLER
jgi:hypothetical protein